MQEGQGFVQRVCHAGPDFVWGPGPPFCSAPCGTDGRQAVVGVGGAQPLAQATDAGSHVLHDAWGQNCRRVSAPPRCPPGQGAEQAQSDPRRYGQTRVEFWGRSCQSNQRSAHLSVCHPPLSIHLSLHSLTVCPSICPSPVHLPVHTSVMWTPAHLSCPD